jgi:prevent-host-death family protein
MDVPAGEFKAKCLGMMEDVRRRRIPLTITKRGKPIARLVPIEEAPKKPLFGVLSGTLTSEKDIIKPTGEVWDVET